MNISLKGTKVILPGDQTLTFLRRYPHIKELTLRGVSLQSVSGLKHLKALEQLYITEGTLHDVSELATLPSIKRLQLQNLGLKDISALAGVRAEWLDLSDNQIESLAPLEGNPHVKQLIVKGNALRDHRCPIAAKGGICVFTDQDKADDDGRIGFSG